MATTVLGLKTFAASDPVDVNEVNDNYVKIDNGVKTAMQGRAAHNYLDNSNWQNKNDIVNQRGKSSYSTNGNEYTIDRWKTQYGTGLTIENGYINIIGQWQIYQVLKNPKDGVYTFAAEIRINSIGDNQPNMYISSGKECLLDAPIGQWKTYILQYDLSSIESDNISFSLCARGGNNSNASISARWAAMYKGSYTADTLPAYHPKENELAECQRYARIRNVENYAIAILGAEKVFAIEHPGMRIGPTVQVINPLTNAVGNIASYTTGGEFTAEIVSITKDRTIVKVESGTPGNTYMYAYNINADL